jgi:hypothetical protein
VIAVVAWLWMRKASDIPIVPSRRGQGGRIVVSMISIPGGTFLAGVDEHPVTLKPFYIDTSVVTAVEFCSVIHCTDAPAAPDLPAVNMTVAQAREYAGYRGKRLPTALEWERAARESNPAYRIEGNIWELVESPGASGAQALSIFAGVLRPPRPMPDGASARDVGLRCAKDP